VSGDASIGGRGRPGRERSADGTVGAADVTVSAARRLNRAAGTLAASVLLDSAVEHYRGCFHNRAMLAPLVSAALSVAVSAHGNADRRAAAHGVRDGVYTAAIVTGLAGSGFHLYNVRKRPGRWRWQNLFYGAPLGAPAALVLSGVTGLLAERVRHTRPGAAASIAGIGAGRVAAAAAGAGLLGTAAEAGLLHFRGAYHNPLMYLPVTIPPLAAVAMGSAALGADGRQRPLTRWLLRLTVALGVAGAALHARGVARSMGGWRNWRQNVLNGPPLPAPPSFAGLALEGLAALALMRRHPDG
jgi:hypothetical protein